MIKTQVKKRQHHPFRNHDDLLFEQSRTKSSKDCSYINKMMKNIFDHLNQHNVSEYQMFIELFKNSGLKMASIVSMMSEFRKYVSEELNKSKEIEWLKIRELRKVDHTGKNLVFNRFACEYPKELYDFVETYLSQNHSEIQNISFLLKEFKEKIELVTKQEKQELFSNVSFSVIEFTKSSEDEEPLIFNNDDENFSD